MSDQLATIKQPEISTLSLIGRIVDSGITTENVSVVERMIALRREETVAENKAAFNRALFALKKEISGMDFYADKSAKTKSGAVAYTYCSESEISEKLEPVLFKHGFAMLFGQRQDGERFLDTYRRIGMEPFKDGFRTLREARAWIAEHVADRETVRDLLLGVL